MSASCCRECAPLATRLRNRMHCRQRTTGSQARPAQGSNNRRGRAGTPVAPQPSAEQRESKEFRMALLERVSTLIRANLNDLIDKAEDPEKMIKQVILDMQNQLLQVKTQVAIAIADQHLLEKKQKDNEVKVAEWMRKAELAVDKKEDDLARASLLRVESYRELSQNFTQQVADQKAQVENLKSALRQLEQKLTEAQAKADVLIAQHRRARAVGKANDARMASGDGSRAAAFDRMKRKVAHSEAVGQAKGELASEDIDDRLAALEKEDRVEKLLAELKAKRGA